MLIGFDASRAFVFEATGTENYSLNLLHALAEVDRKNQYRVYLRGQSSRALTMNNWPRNFEFKVIRPNRLWTQVGLALETWREPVDLLFVPAHTLPVFRNPRIKTVVTIHDLGVEYLPGYHQFPQRYYLDFASRYAARHADAIIAVSAATKRDLINRYGVEGEKVFVVHEGVDRSFFRPRSAKEIKNVKIKYQIDGNYILFVGTIQPRKNLQMLIKVFSLLVGSRESVVGRIQKSTNYKLPATNFVIAGKLGWDYDEILALPKKLGIASRVKFLGYVPDADLPALYSGAVVFAFPSLFEGFGLPILGALSCGCPVVASDIGPHREIFKKISRNSQFASSKELVVPMILVKPTDVDKWVNVLYQYISQYKKRFSFGNINSALEREFSWYNTAKETLEVFKKVHLG
ncbi:MAG: glycosyltransferase family 1 protein [Patescibacteria group bacterium]